MDKMWLIQQLKIVGKDFCAKFYIISPLPNLKPKEVEP